jgi:hypothetical protein
MRRWLVSLFMIAALRTHVEAQCEWWSGVPSSTWKSCVPNGNVYAVTFSINAYNNCVPVDYNQVAIVFENLTTGADVVYAPFGCDGTAGTYTHNVTLPLSIFGVGHVVRADTWIAFNQGGSHPVTLCATNPQTFVIPAPAPATVIGEPGNVSACEGQSATFSAVAGGAAPIAYQWKKNTVNIAGANAATYTIPAVTQADVASYTVFVSNSCGSDTSAAASLSVPATAPSLTSIVPGSTGAGGPLLVLTLGGNNFDATTVARWDGSDLPTSYVSSTQLLADVSAALIANGGTHALSAYKAGGQCTSTAALTFSVNNPVPVLASLAPTSAYAGQGGFTLLVEGASFVASSSVRWNGSALPTTYLGPTQVAASVAANLVASAASVEITVFNPSPAGGSSGGLTLPVNNPLPVLASLAPAGVAAGHPSFTLAVQGSGFVATSKVRWNGANLATTFSHAGKLYATVGAGLLGSSGSAAIDVQSPLPGGGVSAALSFAIGPMAPVLTGISPGFAPAGSGTMLVTLTGANYSVSSKARWDGQELPTAFASATQLTATLSSALLTAPGKHTIDVGNAGAPAALSVKRYFVVGKPALLVAKQSYLVGSTPLAIAVGDLDRDGNVDAATTGMPTGFFGGVIACLGDGHGGFEAGDAQQMFFASGSPASCVQLGDVNGDALLDLVASNAAFQGQGQTVAYRLGDGQGAFGSATAVNLGIGSDWLSLSDVNGDGRVDLVVPDWLNDAVRTSLGVGAGAFAPPTQVTVGIPQYQDGPRFVATADTNGDGKLDLLTANPIGDTISSLLGDGTGTFGSLKTYFAGLEVEHLSVGDLDQDGRVDLVVPSPQNLSTSFQVRLGTGDGGFPTGVSYSTGQRPHRSALADMNNDGALDVAVTSEGSNTVSVYLGNGSGQLGPAIVVATGIGPIPVAMADLDADGRQDLLVAEGSFGQASYRLHSYLGTGFDGLVASGVHAVASEPEDVAAGDLEGDGDLDLVSANETSKTVSVLIGNGLGSFGTATEYSTGSGRPVSIALADLDADAALDAVLALSNSDHVAVLLGTGVAGFGSASTFATGESPEDALALDLDGDSAPDIVVANRDSDDLSVLLGSGSGTFGPATAYATGTRPIALAAGDLDMDGALDVIAALGGGGGGVVAHLGNGSGSLGPLLQVASSSTAHVAVADLDADGDADVAAMAEGTVSVALGDGAGAFAATLTYAGHSSAREIGVVDLDGDGDPDLATANEDNNHNVSVLIGDGSGAFGAPIDQAAGSQRARAICLGDFDGDLAADVAISNTSHDEVGVALNASTGFGAAGPFGSGTWGCLGVIGIQASSAPRVGNPNFALSCTNAPRNGVGFALLAVAANPAGVDLLGFGFLLHVDLLAVPSLPRIPMTSDVAGAGYAPLAIPDYPALAGQVIYAQAVYFEKAPERCTPALFGIVSSKGLQIRILP